MNLKYRFGKSSISRMKGVDARLIILVTTYMCLGKKDIGVTYGVRTKEAQEHMLATGKSKVKNSKHIPIKETITTPDGFNMEIMESNAIDIVAYKNGKPVWDREFYEDIIKDMKEIAKFYGWQDIMNWGWDFKTLNDPYHISVKENGDGGIK
ncbi:MAG: hypothetical protein ACRC1T_09250 [Clostridium chrysemydis]|uniref:hypothetical protein n=1 Tax=Clostridium chrysemydis TaxID=2665504 RepID=UPI003F3CB1C6